MVRKKAQRTTRYATINCSHEVAETFDETLEGFSVSKVRLVDGLLHWHGAQDYSMQMLVIGMLPNQFVSHAVADMAKRTMEHYSVDTPDQGEAEGEGIDEDRVAEELKRRHS